MLNQKKKYIYKIAVKPMLCFPRILVSDIIQYE